jgi:protocatechuate 3,4-dioxygenase alpha subunit
MTTERLTPLSEHTIGPFFPASFFQDGDNDLTRVSAHAAPTERGERILLRGRVWKFNGVPVVNGIVELWQADSFGRFRHPEDPEWLQADPNFLGWGRAWTDADGQYSFHTVIPGGYAEGSGRRAPHANIAVMGAGLMRPVRTTLFFPDFAEANAGDPVLSVLPAALRPRLVAFDEDRTDGVRAFRFDIRLRASADEETPFFEI